MKKILLSLAAVGALAAGAAPAAAQPWRGDYDGGYHESYRGRLTTAYVDSLDWKIRNAAREGRISWGEARELRGEFREVQPIAWRVETGRADRWETMRLQRTVDHIEWAVHRGDRDGYGWRR
jgi:hypothetical protein